MNSLIDVRAVLPAIRMPTLVIHRGTDYDVRVEEGRYIAERIRGARFVELPGADHFVGVDSDQILDVVEPFLAQCGAAAPAPPDDRVLVTLLYADVADAPTEVVRAELGRHRGREVERRGGGLLASFDGPARAVRCATAIAAAGVGARAGVHTGEVELVDGHMRGIALDVAVAIPPRPPRARCSCRRRSATWSPGPARVRRPRKPRPGRGAAPGCRRRGSSGGGAPGRARGGARGARARARPGAVGSRVDGAGRGRRGDRQDAAGERARGARPRGRVPGARRALPRSRRHRTSLPAVRRGAADAGARAPVRRGGGSQLGCSRSCSRCSTASPPTRGAGPGGPALGGQSTLDLVAFLAHNLGERRVLLVGTYRADEPARRSGSAGS